ncbi:MAG: 6-bladed beta-propeller [Acidobacteriota bacterium]
MKKKILYHHNYYFRILTILTVILFLYLLPINLKGEIKNQDKPAKGESLFQIKECWNIEEAEGNPFGSIRQILVSKNGLLCCLDDKFKRLYLFDKNGKFIKGFGKKGEGPGEIKQIRQARLHNAENFIAIQDINSIHYFNWNGEYLESKPNPKQKSPILFLKKYEFITAPRSILAAQDGIAEVKQINLESGKETVITKFSMYKGGAIQNNNNSASMIAEGLTPLFELGIHENRLYYGVSDKYVIHISGIDGKAINGFSLLRNKYSITEKEKVEPILRAAKGLAPEELLKTLAKKLPDEETYYTAIQSHKGLIFIFISKWTTDNSRQIDIFSPEGKYLYRKFIKIESGFKIENTPLIKGNFLYLIIQNEDDETSIRKYEIGLPG